MAVTWLLVVMAAAVFVSMVILAAVCLRCRTKGPLVSIRQANASDEPTEFRDDHPTQPINQPINQPSPYSPLADPGSQWRHRSFTETGTPSYENPPDGPDYINGESDADDPGYIIVLPEGEAPPPPDQSRASTPSSDVLHDYENVPEKKDAASPSVGRSPSRPSTEGEEEDGDYLNVVPLQFHKSSQSSSSDEDDDDDDDGNYVNVQEGTQSASFLL